MAYKTFAQLTTNALLQADETAGSGSATAKTIIQAGINEAYSEIAAVRNWKQLENTGTFTTTSGTMEYTPITSSASVPRIRRISSVLDETNNQYLNEIQREDFEHSYPYVDTTSSNNLGYPQNWFESGYASSRDIKLKLFNVPNGTFTIRAWWYEEPLPLAADADIPRIPDQFQDGLIYLGLARYYEFQRELTSTYYRNLHEQYKANILNDEWGYTDDMPAFKPQKIKKSFIKGKLGRVYN